MSLYYLPISKKGGKKKKRSEKTRSKIVELRFCYKLGWSLKPTMGRFYTTNFLYTISLTMVLVVPLLLQLMLIRPKGKGDFFD